MNNSLIAHINNSKLELKWSNTKSLKNYYSIQTSRKLYTDEEMNDDNLFFIKFNEIANTFFHKTISILPNLENIKNVLDIGSGIAIFDLLMSQYWKDSKFYLLDKSSFTIKENFEYYSPSNNHGFYNSWDVVTDCIDSSKLDKNQFIFLEPDNELPTELDLVISTFSWMYHYPKDVYWDKVYQGLKKGGYLIVDILNKDDSPIDEISDIMKSKPIVDYNKYMPNYSYKNDRILSTGIHSGRYCWVKNI